MEIKKKVELLAPAGDYTCFLAALNAGADAIYLGGDKFGARAYANNFTEEEIISALIKAHLFGKKIYITVNTLVKENEINGLIPFIQPLYDAGLDGVIVQDLGVFNILKENFPGLELHASTQMSITGHYGASLLKSLGACRVVPARELSLDEVKDIKEKTGLEIECFIHGAMCYGYSGQCLFSSILGGRSGNRGRCAGPCRLPYNTKDQKNIYPLSLKDMYTLDIIPELIEAGIDSFKIEGRMKSPEYVAGVTSLYRKYIDKYMANPNQPFKVDKKDEELLRGLYIRSDICQGYYKQHNSKSMVSITEPGYKGCSEAVINDIRSKYIENKVTLPIRGICNIEVGKEASLSLIYNDISVISYGDIVSEANNRPVDKEEITNRISKLGDTSFVFESLEVITDNKSFMPVKVLNELRRQACELLENEIISRNVKRTPMVSYDIKDLAQSNVNVSTNKLFVYVTTKEQLISAHNCDSVSGIYINADIDGINSLCSNSDKDLYLALPYILRKRSYQFLNKYNELLNSGLFKGVLIRNHEEYQWLQSIDYKGEYIADFNIYSWNKESDKVFDKLYTRTTMPVELNKKEILQVGNERNKELVLYSRIPLMYSANCVQKTLKGCLGYNENKNIFVLTDRYKNDFPILQNCIHCYNVLYNTVPMSLHSQFDYLMDKHFAVYRIDFSIEDKDEAKQILDYYSSLFTKEKINEFPVTDYTNGHYKRGVE